MVEGSFPQQLILLSIAFLKPMSSRGSLSDGGAADLLLVDLKKGKNICE
jgi:hypothetical protein